MVLYNTHNTAYVCCFNPGACTYVNCVWFPWWGRFENGGQPYSGVLNHPTLTGDVFAVSAVLHWLDLLLASVDAYSWALEKKLLSPSEVFSSEVFSIHVHWHVTHRINFSTCLCVTAMVHKPGDKESKLFASVNFFLEHLALQDIQAAAECFKSGHTEELVFTPREVDLYKRCRTIVSVRYVCECYVNGVQITALGWVVKSL